MKRILFLAAMLATTAAHAGWSDGPGDHTYDDTGSGGSSAIVALIVCVFAIYGFYKYVTRND